MKRILASAAFLLVSAVLMGQANTTPGMAAQQVWGQKTLSYVNSATPTQFWFALEAVSGRCYCVETANYETGYGDKFMDTKLTVYRQDHATPIVVNDDNNEEPKGYFLSRACWVHNLPNETVFVKLAPSASIVASNSTVSLRFLETTLFCPWFFVAGDYNAFSLIRNTSYTDLPGVVVTWRGLNGIVAGSTTVTIPANGTVVLNARTFVNPALFSNGSVEIAYPGAPDQLQGSTTTLSGTTGLGFDALFTQRKPW
ncbi:MAG: hypothetical protein ABI592_08490 [Acidobacteriota bacterium]